MHIYFAHLSKAGLSCYIIIIYSSIENLDVKPHRITS